MSTLLRHATLGAALLAGTAAAQAQTVIMQEPAYAAPAYVGPTYVAPGYVATAPLVAAPAGPMVAPAPVVVAQPAPIYAEAPVIAQPGPTTQQIVAQPQTVVSPPTARVQETVIRQSSSQPTAIHRSARTSRVHLTRTQRREVLRTIRYERTAPVVRQQVATRPAITSIGSVLPATVQTYAMPRQVVYEAPALQGYAYAPVGDRVLLVEPASNVVVDELY